ncbi:putative protein kinase [Trypanosoma grayi]|uniref:putative protein kinase n=1 Tax=Trypanosoma grayi TaxID=71804 RepID=UPI0004F41157|nr:putative protein kinase [Trypanosoma grayi]KEG12263.1 putative protein kinase [Trypanosoma grayi]
MVEKEAQSETCFAFDILSEGQTEVNDVVADEIEFLKANYDSIHIVECDGHYPRVLLTLDAELIPKRRVVLEVSIVAGYPFVAPKVRILLAHGVTPGSSGALDETEVKQIQADVKETISPCLLAGAPCIMQIIAVVERVLSNGVHRSCTPPAPAKTTEAAAPPPPTPTVQAQEVVKLGVLLLHLLNKCCHLKDPESKEEASGNYQSLAHYLITDVKALPKKLQKCIPWKYDYAQRAFRDSIHESMDSADALTKWLWAQEEGTGTFQRSSPGRYKSEFIEQRMLGSGGFAPVYVCRKKVDGRLYAVKKIVIRTKQSEKALREVQSLAALTHKHIVRYYDAWIEPGCDEGLMDYVGAAEEEEAEEYEEEEEEEDALPIGNAGRRLLPYCRLEKTIGEEEETSSDEESSHDSSDDDDDFPRGVLSTPYLAHTEEYHTLYIQMELCSKQTLRHLIDRCDKEEKSLFTSDDGEKMAARIFRQLLTVVAHFHGERIVHRDLKPDNILFEMENSTNGGEIGTIRVGDFGLARTMHPSVKRNASSFNVDDPKSIDELEIGARPTGNLGSVLYCAPEQEQGENYDFKVDEYSLGMIALEMWLAVAGKGFRERFNIMTEVSEGKMLPQWFWTWNPRMAGVISNLLEREPSARRSCEEVLNTAELPGDPADIVEALETIERHGERMAGRVLHCVHRIMVNHYRRPHAQIKENVKALASNVVLDIMQAVSIIGILHGAAPIACCDALVPMNPSLNELDVPCVLDMGSRVWALPSQPQLATASFFSMLASPNIGSFYQFYYRTRPYAVFTSPLSARGVFDEAFLDPLLSFLHLLSVTDLTSKLDIIISHSNWLNATHPTQAGSQQPPSEVLNMREMIDSSEMVRPAVYKIECVLAEAGVLAPSLERHELVRNFTSGLLEVLPLFGKQVASNISLSIDPALKPSETSVDKSFLESGLIFECRTRDESKPIAFCCGLENFTSKCAARNTDVTAICLNIDLIELGAVGRHVRFPSSEAVLFSGVAIRRQDVYSPNQINTVLTAAVRAWGDNIRACLRSDHDTRGFCKAMKGKGIQAVLLDGSQIVSLAPFQQGKVGSRSDAISPEKLCLTIRKKCVERPMDVEPKDPVIFFMMKEKRALSENAMEVLSMIRESLTHILVVDEEVKRVEESVRQIVFDATTLEGERVKLPELVDWLKKQMSKHSLLPIYSVPDRTVTFLVDQKQFRPANHNDNGKRRK